MKSFNERVKEIVSQIPAGQVMSYKEVATVAGNKKAARVVANIMAKNYDPNIPCHRVIRSDGKLSGYNRGGTEVKRRLLVSEGAVI